MKETRNQLWGVFASGVTLHTLYWVIHQRLSVQSFYWGLGTYVSSVQHVYKFQNLKGNKGVQSESHCLYRQCRHKQPLLLLKESFICVGNCLSAKIPGASGGSILQTEYSKARQLRPTTLALFCTEILQELFFTINALYSEYEIPSTRASCFL